MKKLLLVLSMFMLVGCSLKPSWQTKVENYFKSNSNITCYCLEYKETQFENTYIVISYYKFNGNIYQGIGTVVVDGDNVYLGEIKL